MNFYIRCTFKWTFRVIGLTTITYNILTTIFCFYAKVNIIIKQKCNLIKFLNDAYDSLQVETAQN
jgi:hypothetical protein